MATDSRGYALGLLITAGSVFAAQARIRNEEVEITAWNVVETPEGAVEGTSIIDPSRVAQAIRLLLRQMGIARMRSASVALLSPSYSMRTLRLPDVPVGERRTLVRGELEQVGVLPFGGGAFDFLWVPGPTVEGRRTADVYAYHTSDAEVDAIRETLRLAGLQLDSVEPASLAMMRACLDALPEPQTMAVLCTAQKHSDMCIHDGQRVRHMRRIPAGWADLLQTEGQPAPLGIAPEPEEAAARPLRDEMTDFDLGGSGAKETTEEPVESLGLRHTPSLAFLASEIVRTLAFYSREYPDAPVPRSLAILGSAPVIQDFRRVMEGSLPLPITKDDPLAAVGLPPAALTGGDDWGAGFLTAVGAALGAASAETSLPVVDISQQEKAAITRRRAPTVLLVGMAGSTLWMVLAAVAAIGLTFLESSAQEESSRLGQEIARVKEERAAKLKYQELLAAAQVARAKSEIPAADILGRVAAAAMPGVAVTGIKADSDGKVSIEGEALDTSSMQRFANAINEGRSTRLPYFEMMRRDEKGRLSFRLVAMFREKAGR
jgi:Tfp pilus assembly PilM family ATPase